MLMRWKLSRAFAASNPIDLPAYPCKERRVVWKASQVPTAGQFDHDFADLNRLSINLFQIPVLAESPFFSLIPPFERQGNSTLSLPPDFRLGLVHHGMH